MPARKQITKEKILSAALDVLREKGEGALSILNITKKLSCSTQPIYYAFSGMDELKCAVMDEARKIYDGYTARELEGKKDKIYMCYGMAYLRFAMEEPEAFKMLYLRRRSEEEKKKDEDSLDGVIKLISSLCSLTPEDAYRFHSEMWIYVHGLAVSLATSFLTLDDDILREMLTHQFIGLKYVYGVKG